MKKTAILTIGLLMLLTTSVQADLVALYHLDGNADDSSGNGNNGTVYGAGYVGGMFGQALSFDGSDDYVGIGTANLVTGAHTVEFWAYSSSEDAEAFLEFNLDSLGFISYKDKQERVMCGHRGGVQPYTGPQTFPLGQWNHIALVYNGGSKSDSASYKIYINGVDQATTLPWGFIGSSFECNYIGRERNTYGNSTIDEVRIWDEALTELPGILPVAIDIHPGSCPNPFNAKSQGSVPVAVVGTADFDVTTLDPTSITLNGVPALVEWVIKDSTQPGDKTDCFTCFDADDPANFNCDLWNAGTVEVPIYPPVPGTDGVLDSYCGDGYLDLIVKFDTQALAVAIGDVPRDSCITLDLEGETIDGLAIGGSDSVIIRTK